MAKARFACRNLSYLRTWQAWRSFMLKPWGCRKKRMRLQKLHQQATTGMKLTLYLTLMTSGPLHNIVWNDLCSLTSILCSNWHRLWERYVQYGVGVLANSENVLCIFTAACIAISVCNYLDPHQAPCQRADVLHLSAICWMNDVSCELHDTAQLKTNSCVTAMHRS